MDGNAGGTFRRSWEMVAVRRQQRQQQQRQVAPRRSLSRASARSDESSATPDYRLLRRRGARSRSRSRSGRRGHPAEGAASVRVKEEPIGGDGEDLAARIAALQTVLGGIHQARTMDDLVQGRFSSSARGSDVLSGEDTPPITGTGPSRSSTFRRPPLPPPPPPPHTAQVERMVLE
ncbi:unnamed protein product, partial [Polarella glacialis]